MIGTVASAAPSWTEREQGRSGRAAGGGLLLATAVAGMSFSGVFTPAALVLPVLAVVAGVAAADQLTLGRARPAAVRAPLGLLLGATAGTAALLLPSGAALSGAGLRVVAGSVLHGWLRSLESTLPAHPDLTLVGFVPALVLLAAVVGIEWLRRGVAPPLTLLPSLAVLVLAQLFASVDWLPAVGLAAAYGVGAGVVLADGLRWTETVGPALSVVLVAVLGGGVLAVTDPVGGPAWSMQDRIAPSTVTGGAVSPLAELAGRLDRPDEVVFTARADAPVTRWPLVVLDDYDGAGFTSSARYRPLGAQLPPDPTLTVPVRPTAADVTVAAGFTGPWLPGQGGVRSVEGLRPAVDPETGNLLLPDGAASARYRLAWFAPQPGPEQLVGAAVDPEAGGTEINGTLPAAVTTAAAGAVRGAPPSFDTALTLERWFRDNYGLAGADQRPTGSGDVQLGRFLTDSRSGTSEQFAAAYVLMARAVGIPARLVVGFRPGPAGPDGVQVVRNGDAFAWPEVAVAGAGWVPLDPTGGAREATGPSAATDAATETARRRAAAQPVAPAPAPPAAVAMPPDAEPISLPGRWDAVLAAAGIAVAGVVLLALLGVPSIKRVRRARRRRSQGSGAVVGAWLEVRDRLRDHGVEATTDMTVRDLRRPAGPVLNGSGAELERLARCVDEALWSGAVAPADLAARAWGAEKSIRGALTEQPLRARVRAAVRLRGLTRVRDTRL
jgi:protein-glutamine gamma-glutamyltransferase